MESVLLFIFGITGGFVLGLLVCLLPYLYRKHRKRKTYGFGYRYRNLTEEDLNTPEKVWENKYIRRYE